MPSRSGHTGWCSYSTRVMETPANGVPSSDAPPTVEAVREATRAVLPLVDLELLRERDVVAMVEQRLGAMVAETELLRAAVQDEIDKRLLQEEGDDVLGTAPAGANTSKPKPKRKRGNDLDGFVVDDEDDEDYEDEDEDDEDGRSKKPTNNRRYTKEEWQEARHDWSKPAPAVVDPAKGAATAPAPKVAAVDDSKIFIALSLTPDGQTAKSLSGFLKTSKSEVNKALYRLQASGKVVKKETDGAPTWSAAAGAVAGGAGAGVTLPMFGAGGGASAGATGAATPTAPAPAPVPATGVSGDTSVPPVDGQICALTKSKRVVVGEYRGKKNLSLREYYEKDGKWLPGKKGISLSQEQWIALKKHVASDDVGKQLKADPNAADFLVGELSPTRRLTISSFRNSPTIGVREYYEKDGKMLPGFKGMNMSVEQWGVFCGLVQGIDKAMAL